MIFGPLTVNSLQPVAGILKRYRTQMDTSTDRTEQRGTKTSCQNGPHSSRPLNDRGSCGLHPERRNHDKLWTVVYDQLVWKHQSQNNSEKLSKKDWYVKKAGERKSSSALFLFPLHKKFHHQKKFFKVMV